VGGESVQSIGVDPPQPGDSAVDLWARRLGMLGLGALGLAAAAQCWHAGPETLGDWVANGFDDLLAGPLAGPMLALAVASGAALLLTGLARLWQRPVEHLRGHQFRPAPGSSGGRAGSGQGEVPAGGATVA